MSTDLKVAVVCLGVGVILLFERGMFASILLGAHAMGNIGFTQADGNKIMLITWISLLSIVVGVILLIASVKPKNKS